LIEAVNLVPDFLEDLVSNNLLDALSGGVIRMELLCQIALERSIPDVSNLLTAIIVSFMSPAFLVRTRRLFSSAKSARDFGRLLDEYQTRRQIL
jgi:hypothetical protein